MKEVCPTLGSLQIEILKHLLRKEISRWEREGVGSDGKNRKRLDNNIRIYQEIVEELNKFLKNEKGDKNEN